MNDWTDGCWVVCLADEFFLWIVLLDPDSERHLQVRYIRQHPAFDREHTYEPDVRGQGYIWGFWQQIQVCIWNKTYV